MKRALIRALLLGLVPVLVITARPEVASATIKIGTVNTVHYDPGGTSTPADDTDCASNFYWARTDMQAATISVYGTGCSTGYNISSLTVSFHVKGAGCDFYGGPSAELDGTGTSGHFNTLVGDAATESAMIGVPAPTCSPTQWCTTASIDTHAGWMTPGTGGGEERCETISMGPPPVATTASGNCTNGTVTPPSLSAVSEYAPSFGYVQRHQSATVALNASTATTTQQWMVYAIVKPTNTAIARYTADEWAAADSPILAQRTFGDKVSSPTVAAGTSVNMTVTPNLGLKVSTAPGTSVQDGTIVGVGMVDVSMTGGVAPSNFMRSSTHPAGYLGITDPSKCAFYWGAKVASTATDTLDEPAGDLSGAPADDPLPTDPDPTLPEPTTDGCDGFSFTDPSSWAGAGICELVKAIGALVGVVRGLFGIVQQVLTWLLGLLDNLRGLFMELFVPDPASWDTDGLMTQLEARPPASILADIAAGMASMVAAYNGAGCGTLVHFGADVDQSITCSQVKSIPGWNALYALMQVALFSLTGLAVYRMLSGVFEKG